MRMRNRLTALLLALCLCAVVNRMLGRSGDADYIRGHGDSLTRFPDLAEEHWK